MFELESVSGPWRRVERRATGGQVLYYVEVGACAQCGCGVERAFPLEYQLVEGALLCVPSVQGGAPPAPGTLEYAKEAPIGKGHQAVNIH